MVKGLRGLGLRGLGLRGLGERVGYCSLSVAKASMRQNNSDGTWSRLITTAQLQNVMPRRGSYTRICYTILYLCYNIYSRIVLPRTSGA